MEDHGSIEQANTASRSFVSLFMFPRTRLYTSHPALQRRALLVRSSPPVQRTSFATSARRLVEEAATVCFNMSGNFGPL